MIALPTESEPVAVVQGDCAEVLRELPADVIDLVVTSPPYNLGGEPWPHLGNWKQGDSAGGKSKWRNGSDAATGIQYASHEDSLPWAEYVAWQRAVLSALWASLSDHGAIFYNHKPRVIGGRLWTPQELLPPEVILRQIVIWARPGGLNFNPTAFVPTHEWVMVIAKPGFRLKSRAASGVGDVWQIPADRDNPHPAPFPVELARRCIEPTRAALVLDPFAGSGSALLGALREGRRAIGIELDAGYCELARTRVNDALGIGRGSLLAPAAGLFDDCTHEETTT